jgi:hypothetical protein
MSLSQEEQEALNHHKKMLQIRTKNLYILEEQEAGYGGLNVPTHILSQIDKSREQIHEHKEEIDRLETIAVQDKIPLAEVEYSVTLAEAWNTSQGHPTVVGRKRLEFARLRLHITPDRAREMEWGIRKELASEELTKMDFSDEFIQELCNNIVLYIHGNDREPNIFARDGIMYFERVIRLYPIAAIDYIFLEYIIYKNNNDMIGMDLMIKHKNKWLQKICTVTREGDQDYLTRSFHQYLEPQQPFDASEWEELLPF